MRAARRGQGFPDRTGQPEKWPKLVTPALTGRLDRRVNLAPIACSIVTGTSEAERGSAPSDEALTVSYPGARRPDRHRSVDTDGLRLAVSEWGDIDAPPILFAHGGFDFAGTYDVFAPMVADAGWRVVAWDQRGHGDSAYAHLYSWEADVRDALVVIDSIGPEPLPVLGHSKGGSLMLQLADAAPHRVSAVINLDGLPSTRSWPDVPEHNRTRMLLADIEGWLDHRRRAETAVRRPGTLDELAERRGRMNPRLSKDWLRYLVTVGARQRSRWLAMEDRPGVAARGIRPLATGVVDVAAAIARHAGDVRARPRGRDDGLGNPA